MDYEDTRPTLSFEEFIDLVKQAIELDEAETNMYGLFDYCEDEEDNESNCSNSLDMEGVCYIFDCCVQKESCIKEEMDPNGTEFKWEEPLKLMNHFKESLTNLQEERSNAWIEQGTCSIQQMPLVVCTSSLVTGHFSLLFTYDL
jgi:hypothetical protein